MKEYYQLINELDGLPDNKARNEFLISIKKNPLIPRHDFRRIACNILLEDNFIERNYKISILEKIKICLFKLNNYFAILLRKRQKK
ncbi:hypothetical protein NZD88_21085 [Chryseobacterium antibioticum]|uniref:Uncharacterized protein n=1 Tax=Chryseobacterium pyrolae TaxID=2987481 RepID=A0ABT2IN24_9FLAO|nr:hypothetical protein [Chryseobacterium pyrolae]MCT2410059.1 hypothetical protein [Chryseobacterium pyrolae]